MKRLAWLLLFPLSTLAQPTDGGVDTLQAFGGLHLKGSSEGGLGLVNRKPGDGGIFEPVVTGSLHKDVIRRVMQQHSGEVRACAMNSVDAGTVAVGKLTVHFVINKTGAVSESKVTTSTLNNPALENCVAEVIFRAVFPAPAGGGIVVVNYPYSFVAP